MTRLRIFLGVGICVCVGAIAGPWLAQKSDHGAPSRHIARLASYPRWPAESLVDWAGFADQVSVISIVSERQLPMEPDVIATGEGLVGRVVGVRIESTVWSRPGAPSVSGTVELPVDGWIAHDHKLIPAAEQDSARPEVGDRAIVPLVQTPQGLWSLLASTAIVPLTARGAAPVATAAAAGAAKLRGLDVPQVAALLAATRPSSIAAKYQNLDPDARATAVRNETLAGTSGQG